MYNEDTLFNPNRVYIQTDVSSFKEVVQFLTSSPEFRTPGTFSSKPTNVIKNDAKKMKKKQILKVQEKSKQMKNLMMMNSSTKLALPFSPSSIYLSSTSNRFSSVEENVVFEEKNGFHLHTSAMVMPRASEPQLLPLFPMTSSSSV